MCFSFKGCYNYLYRMKALDAIRDSGYFSFQCNYIFIKQLWDFPFASTLLSKCIHFAYIIDISQV